MKYVKCLKNEKYYKKRYEEYIFGEFETIVLQKKQ